MKRLPLITSIVICLGAIATIVVNVRSCRQQAAGQVQPAPLSPAERTQKLIRERMADPVYSNGLAKLAERQTDLARLRNDAVREFEAWRVGFLSSNAEARAVFGEIQELVGKNVAPTNAAFAALAEKFEKIVAEDPRGRELLAMRDKINYEIAEHQATIADFVGGNVRRQRLAHAGEEMADAQRIREERIAEGKIKPRKQEKPNFPEPRQKGWATNAPAPPPASGGQMKNGSGK